MARTCCAPPSTGAVLKSSQGKQLQLLDALLMMIALGSLPFLSAYEAAEGAVAGLAWCSTPALWLGTALLAQSSTGGKHSTSVSASLPALPSTNLLLLPAAAFALLPAAAALVACMLSSRASLLRRAGPPLHHSQEQRSAQVHTAAPGHLSSALTHPPPPPVLASLWGLYLATFLLQPLVGILWARTSASTEAKPQQQQQQQQQNGVQMPRVAWCMIWGLVRLSLLAWPCYLVACGALHCMGVPGRICTSCALGLAVFWIAFLVGTSVQGMQARIRPRTAGNL